MNWKDLDKIYFVGIGGIGMSALARFFHTQGKSVSGYDRTPTALTSQLQKEGIEINFEDKATHLPSDIKLWVFTPAIPASSVQLASLKERNVPLLKRAEVLGLLSKDYKTLAVAGSHGKTSVSAMLTHLLKSANIDCTALLGGIACNYNSNFIAGTSNVLVLEADEYDRSFLQLSPDLAIITSIDSDHLDIYGSRENILAAFNEFAGKVSKDGMLIYQKYDAALSSFPNAQEYAIADKEVAHVENIKQENGNLRFDLCLNTQTIENCSLEMGALHNVENMLAAALAAEFLGASAESIKAGIGTYKGVKRRFELVYKDTDIVIIDDYAHHPKEIETLLKAVRKLYPSKFISILFQPHLFSRTQDLAEEFAAALSLADRQILLAIYPARELPIEGVRSELIADFIEGETCQVIEMNEIEAALATCESGVILTVGAGDIDKQVQPIKTYFENRKLSTKE